MIIFFKNILTHFDVKYITLTLLKSPFEITYKDIIAAPFSPLYHRHPSRDTGSEMRLGRRRAGIRACVVASGVPQGCRVLPTEASVRMARRRSDLPKIPSPQ